MWEGTLSCACATWWFGAQRMPTPVGLHGARHARLVTTCGEGTLHVLMSLSPSSDLFFLRARVRGMSRRVVKRIDDGAILLDDLQKMLQERSGLV